MPEIGEIKRGLKSQKYVWSKCEDCGKEEWSYLHRERPNRKLCRGCAGKRLVRWGSANGSWKGGQFIAFGYVFKLKPKHPRANYDGYVREHRLIMEDHLGRFLLPSELVHHKNGIRDDNRIENLELLSGGQSEHLKMHKHPRLGHRKWDYSKVYELRDRTGWTNLQMSVSLGIPESTINVIMRKRNK